MSEKVSLVTESNDDINIVTLCLYIDHNVMSNPYLIEHHYHNYEIVNSCYENFIEAIRDLSDMRQTNRILYPTVHFFEKALKDLIESISHLESMLRDDYIYTLRDCKRLIKSLKASNPDVLKKIDISITEKSYKELHDIYRETPAMRQLHMELSTYAVKQMIRNYRKTLYIPIDSFIEETEKPKESNVISLLSRKKK